MSDHVQEHRIEDAFLDRDTETLEPLAKGGSDTVSDAQLLSAFGADMMLGWIAQNKE